ncbi:hydroxymethylbilane synthase [Planctomonas psychrotolerans]|uniref:hydroxymethylbilane synthase n=1 Tax=Planctomonas psychrotolerans TaxID=2528712 RepID=UPI00123C7636|nr:hydroxymethylbilane synthase [Planctomonas psychrotolerans]
MRLGTRGSALALAQAGVVADAIAEAAGQPVELVPISTHGDRSRESLSSLGGTGVFASALREALLRHECDFVVHSLKDLPTAPYDGLAIAAVPARADARDALCARDGMTLADLPSGARVGTGSPRRVAQLRTTRPDLEVVDIRGNVDSRLRRVSEGDLDAVVLAAAGLDRLGRLDAVTEYFPLEDWPTAPGQGALAIEVRAEDLHGPTPLARAVEYIDEPFTHAAVTAERSVLAGLEAGCSAPIGATAAFSSESLSLAATVYQLDGARSITRAHTLPTGGFTLENLPAYAVALAGPLTEELLDAGAAQLAPLRGSAT